MKTLGLDALTSDTGTATSATQLLAMTSIFGTRHRMHRRSIEDWMADSMKLTPADEREDEPEERRYDRGYFVGDQRDKAVSNVRRECAEHNRVVESPDRKKYGNN